MDNLIFIHLKENIGMIKMLLDNKLMSRFSIIYLFLICTSFLFGQRIVGYYPQWVDQDFQLSSIDLTFVTHINHAFSWPDENGNIYSYENMFDILNAQIVHNAGRKILLSVGGGGNDDDFSSLVSSPISRAAFISNLLEICDTYDYDGIDLNWEHPSSTEDRQNLNLLISEMYTEFNANNQELIITMAVPISNWFGQWYDFSFLRYYVEFFNAMTYNIHGDWSGHSGHNAPLFQSPPGDSDGSCVTGINYLINSREILPEQVNMGLPFWGKQYHSEGINLNFTGDVINLWYSEIVDLIDEGWDYEWDANAFAPYLINYDQPSIITYDNPESIGYKCSYANSENLGGVMIWALGYDLTTQGQELMNSINQYYGSLVNVNYSTVFPKFFTKVYPNPFNSNLIIEYELLNDEFLSIDLLSINGELVVSLFNGIGKRGMTKFFLNTSQIPKKISSGFYLIKLNGESARITKKVLYLK